MSSSADGSAVDNTAGATPMAQAAADYAAGRLEAAAAALARAEPVAGDLPTFWEMKGVVALARGAAAEGAAALRRAADLVRISTGIELLDLLLNLATACEVAGLHGEAVAALCSARAVAARAGGDAGPARRAEIEGRLAALLWQLGDHDASIAAYVRATAEAPGDTDALGRLGVMLAWRGRTLEGLLAMLQAAMLQPQAAVPARDVGQMLGIAGAAAAARAWYRRALALQSDEKGALAALAEPAQADMPERWSGVAAVVRGCQTVAEAAGQAGPVREAEALAGLAEALVAARFAPPSGAVADDWAGPARDAAIAVLRRLVAMRSGHPGAQALLGQLLAERGEHEGAEAALRAALKLAPADAALHALLGDLLAKGWRMAAAAASYRASLGLRADQPHVLLGLARALMADWPDEEALAALRRARELDPALPVARAGVGMALRTLQRPDEALAELRAAVRMRPDEAEWRFALSTVLLAQGDFAAGWPEYAWRWRIENKAVGRRPDNPLLRPDPAQWSGRTVLLYAEQGQGDTIQFLRYVRLVVATGARVLLEVQRSLKSLAARIPGVAGLFAQGEPVPAFDVAVPLLHLPWAFDTRLESIPAVVPYLRPNLSRAAAFRRRMQGLPGLKVGLVWAGAPWRDQPLGAMVDRRRSMALASLAPLARVPRVVFVSLQKGEAAVQAATLPAGMVLHDWTAELEDFAATAALMSALDLVISVDTATAHLAGALGRQVWLLNRFDAEWRWLMERDDSPWYPTMRQFRQASPGDWNGVVGRVADALAERAG